MTAIEPKCADAGRYSVTEACILLGIHRNTLERYRANNLIKAGFRMANHRKFYTGSEIKKLWRKM